MRAVCAQCAHSARIPPLAAPLSLQCLHPKPGKCVCGPDATVPVAQLGDALQRAAVAMYPQCPTACTTCFHIILKSALPAHRDGASVFVWGSRWSCHKFRSNVDLHHKEGVLCIICTVAGSNAIKRFRSSSPDAMCTATACTESDQPTAIWHQVVFFAILCCCTLFFRVCSGMWMIHLVGCHLPSLRAAFLPPPHRTPKLCIFLVSAKSYF